MPTKRNEFGEHDNRTPGDRRSALPNRKWNGIERRKSDGRRVCPAHDQIVADGKETVQWRVFVFVMMAGIAIVGAGFGWFGNDILKVKDNQLLIIKTTADHTDRNTLSMANIQKEIMTNVQDNQKETRAQIERIATQLETVSKIQQVVLTEISYLKRYDELDRQNKASMKR